MNEPTYATDQEAIDAALREFMNRQAAKALDKAVSCGLLCRDSRWLNRGCFAVSSSELRPADAPTQRERRYHKYVRRELRGHVGRVVAARKAEFRHRVPIN